MPKPKKPKLPPDPEAMNKDRGQWAEAALQTFMNETGTDPGDAICDLIADMAHLCDRSLQYGRMEPNIRRGMGHYIEETSRKGKQFEEL